MSSRGTVDLVILNFGLFERERGRTTAFQAIVVHLRLASDFSFFG